METLPGKYIIWSGLPVILEELKEMLGGYLDDPQHEYLTIEPLPTRNSYPDAMGLYVEGIEDRSRQSEFHSICSGYCTCLHKYGKMQYAEYKG